MSYLTHGSTNLVYNKTIYAFDFDGTIIQPTGAKFVDTWTCNSAICSLLRKIRERYPIDTPIVVFTNQGSVARGGVTEAQLRRKLDAVFAEIFGHEYIPTVFIALAQSYRKPSPRMWDEYLLEYGPGVDGGYFIGDATDANTDFSDSDYRFALNTSLQYVHVGSVTADTTPDNLGNIVYRAPIDRVLPENIFHAQQINSEQFRGCVVVMIGYPGSGKSTFARWLRSTLPNTIILARENPPCTIAQVHKRYKDAVVVPGTTIIVDATHPSVASREYYIKNASGRRVIAIVMNLSREHAFYLNKLRCIAGSEFVPSIAYGVYTKNYTAPTLAEGFSNIVLVDKLAYDETVTPADRLDLYL